MVTYYGRRLGDRGRTTIVRKDGDILSPGPSQRLINHSPDGFEWGYGGSGPAQLALALLLDATGSEDIAREHYHDFKFEIVAGWGGEWSIARDEIEAWLRRRGVEL